MMKKILVTWIAISIIVLAGINVVNAVNKDMTDKEIAESYVIEEYGEEYYVEMTRSDEDFIRFDVYLDGDRKYLTSIDRDHYTNKYNE